MPSTSLALAAGVGFGCGLLAFRWYLSRSLHRTRYQMFALCKQRAAEDLRALPAVPARCGRSFPMARSDTALVLIDMQSDFLSPNGRVGQHYDQTRLSAMDKTIDKVEELLAACRGESHLWADARIPCV